MTKPIGPVCNLDCEYCFYLEKEALWGDGRSRKMSDAVLERYIEAYIASQPGPEVHFAWQGGEPTLLGRGFFEKVVALQKRFGGNRKITNAFQTNGVLLDEDWASFFRDNDFLVGVSIDGPEKLHDAYRKDRAGRGTWKRVMRGIEVLHRHEVAFNTLSCVNRLTARKPELVYRFLKGIGSRFHQYIPIVERMPGPGDRACGLTLAGPPARVEEADAGAGSRLTPWSVRPEDYGAFLVAIFDRWVRQDVGKVFVQMFDVAFAKWLGLREGGICVFAETCGRALAVEHTGEVYACDHYVYPDYRRGNLLDTPLAAMVDGTEQVAFGEAKRDSLPSACRQCPWLAACNGGCPKHRFARTNTGEPGLNVLCPAYSRFFAHADPYFRVMADLHRRGRPPADVVQWLRENPKALNVG